MRALLLLLVFLIACGDDDSAADTNPADSGAVDVSTDAPDDVPVDTGAADTGAADTGAVDTGAVDSSVDTNLADTNAADTGSTEGFGELFGDCGVLMGEITSDAPSLFNNSIDFGDDEYDPSDMSRLTEGAQEILRDGTAGGSSGLSEAFAYDILERCEGAMFVKSETEIIYEDPTGRLTDILIALEGMKVGVSVTRAVGFPRDDPYTVETARDLLERKLLGVLESSANVGPEDRWVKQILFVVAYGEMHQASMAAAWSMIDEDIRADTIVIVTRTDGMDEVLY